MKAIILTVLIITSSPWIKINSSVDFFIEKNPPIEEQIVYIEEEQFKAEVEEIVQSRTIIESETPEESLVSEEILENADDDWTYSASCIITHYCHCAECNSVKWAYQPTASGTWPEAGRTVAVDPKYIPFGSEVLIDGHIYIAEDTGVTGYHIDIFCDSHQEAKDRGMFTTTVFWR